VSKDLKEWAALFLPTTGERMATWYAAGASLDEIAVEFKTSKSSVRKYLQPYRPTADQIETYQRNFVRKVLKSKPKK
jgi:predicted DNA-binding protein YlxM (UPF0122 family)